MNSKNELPCLFCNWVKREEEYQDLKDENRVLNRYRFEAESDRYLVVLDRDPKVDGHTLIISTKHSDPDHYSDITELPITETDIFKGVIKWAHRIKTKLNKKFEKDFKEKKLKKVYVLSMCDHYDDDELQKLWQYRTEHLHFHLIPRYDFDKDIRGEEVLIRGVELKSEELKWKKLGPKEKLGKKKIFDLLKETDEEGKRINARNSTS